MIILRLLFMVCLFVAGAVWMQCSQTKMAKKCGFRCDRCEAFGCQAQFCMKNYKKLHGGK